MKKTLLFEVKTNSPDGFEVYQVDADKINSIADNVQCIDSFLQNGITYMLAFEKNTGVVRTYQAYNDDGKFLKEVAQNTVPGNATSIAIINSDGVQLCLAYDASLGVVNFLKIASDLSLEQVGKLDAGTGISTLKTFVYRKQLFFIAYNIETGHVAKYEVSVDASSSSVSATEVRADKWAQGWTRFSFFQMGAENFFIKTNLKYNKVNIDHFMDDADEGSHPVLNIDAPSQMVGLNNVSAFTDSKGFPFFATYRTNGEITFNRIYGNCLGWDVEKQLNTESNRELVLPLTINGENYLLIY